MTAITALHRSPHIGHVQRVPVPYGASVQDIAEQFHASMDGLTAWVRNPDGSGAEWTELPRSLWRHVRPKISGVVQFAYRLHNSDVLRSAFTLAATVVASIVAPYLAPIIGTLGATLVGTAITVGASLAAQALFPAESPQATALGKNESRSFANVDSDSNVLAKDAYLSVVMGTRRISPAELAQPRPFLQDGIQSIDRIFALDGHHQVTDLQVDGTPVTDYEGLTTQIVTGAETDPTETFISKVSRVENVSETLSSFSLDEEQLVDQDTPANSEPRWVRFTTATDDKLEEITVRLRFDGMVKTDSATDQVRVPLRVRFRPKGSTGAWTNLPEVHVVGRTTQTTLQEIRLRWDSDFGSSSAVGDLAYSFISSVPAATSGSLSEGTGSQWLAASGMTLTAGRDGVRVALDEAVHAKQEYEFEIKRGAAIRDAGFVPSTYMISGIVHSFFYAYSSGGWRVHEAQGNYTARVSVDYAISLINRTPCSRPGTCLIGLRSVGQSVRNVTCLAQRYVYDWDGSGWKTLTTSENPAVHFRQILSDFLTYQGIDTALIADDEFVAWRAECIARGYKVSAVFAGEPLADVLDQIATAGFARKKLSDIFGIDWFRDRSADRPVQTFSPRNARIGLEWNHRPQPLGVRASFQNADLGYRDDEIQVSNPVYASERGYEVRVYGSIADPALVEQRAFFDLLQAQYQTRRVYMVETAIEGMVCDRGDLVGIVTDLIDDSNSGARITGVHSSTTFDIDQIIPAQGTTSLFTSSDLYSESDLFTTGAQTIALISTPTGTQEVMIAAANGRTIRVSPAITIDDPEDLMGAHITLGPRDRFMRRAIVGEVVRGNEERATLVCVDEAPEIFQAMQARYWQ